jgi:hypothetical protein
MANSDPSKKVSKSKATVTVKLTDGEMFEGHFFVSEGQRVTDLLNGDMQYLPFETLTGMIFVINKAMIARIIAKARQSAEQGEVIPPQEGGWSFRR